MYIGTVGTYRAGWDVWSAAAAAAVTTPWPQNCGVSTYLGLYILYIGYDTVTRQKKKKKKKKKVLVKHRQNGRYILYSCTRTYLPNLT